MTDQEAYRTEARELLTELESSLLELEETPDDPELIGRVFRALHTIKGSGAMFGFDQIAGFTHDVENAFDLVRSGRLRVSPELIGITLAGRDHIRVLLEGGPEEAGAAILERLHAIVGSEAAVQVRSLRGRHPSRPCSRTFRIHFQPAADCFLKGTNPLLLCANLARWGRPA